MEHITAIGYLLSGAFFLLLSLLLLINWQKKLQGGLLILASIMSTLWSFVLAYQIIYQEVASQVIWIVEALRIFSWLAFLAYLLWGLFTSSQKSRKWLMVLTSVFSVISLILLVPYEYFFYFVASLDYAFINDIRIVLLLTLAIIGISLIEQLVRNTSIESRWTIKYLALGLGLGFFYDFYLYSDALLFKRIDQVIWESRGAINVLIAPLVAVSARQNTQWSVNVFVSKQVVFHTTGLLGAGIYLLSMAFIGYYIQVFGGEYGDFFRLIFFGAAILLLFVLISSGQLRARLRVFLNKHFFKYQYDYREEWLNLISLLSSDDYSENLPDRVIAVMTGIVNSEHGSIWSCNSDNHCFSSSVKSDLVLDVEPELWRETLLFLNHRQWVIDVDEYRDKPGVYEGLNLPQKILDHDDVWLIVPLIHEEAVHGFVVLSHSKTFKKLNWENRDLLIMAGRQAASYLVLDEAASQLAEARQFEGFNRLSAFVIHDLKNLIAQLSLVASNAARHKHNPDFIDDAVTTIENSVGKMNRLMMQLKSAGKTEKRKASDFIKLVEEVIAEKQKQKPVPVLINKLQDKVYINAESERLSAVVGHIIQNAQDATPDSGEVEVICEKKANKLHLAVVDTGSGMDEEFIENRLFKPFDTTKGLTGMGIGAYECKEFIQGMRGDVLVQSTPGTGTMFEIVIPVESTMDA